MARFEYQALSPAGEVISGELEGSSAESVIERLRDQALLPIHAVEKQAKPGFDIRRAFGGAKAFPRRELPLFIQQLSRLLRASLPLDRALEILVSLTEERHAARLVQRVLDQVRDGASLAEAMAAQAGAFPRLCISVVRAGEEGSALHQVLARMAEFLLRSEAMRQKVISALIYPAVLVLVASASIGLVLTIVLPQFEPMLRDAGDKLPTIAWLVMLAGDALRETWWMLLLGGLLSVLALRWILQQPRVALWRDRLILHVPIVRSLVIRFEIGRFSRTLGVLLANGVPASRGLTLAGATVGNRVLTDAIETLATRFKEGEGLARSLAATGRFPHLAIQLIQIGEETGRLDEMLQEVAETYDSQVERTLERLLALLVPAIIIAMGLVVGLILAAVMTALVSINDLAA